ncbi:MAG: MFS transporter [Gammaproteobacteria bacterium]|nr:MFS transporter [Gammaproteobacteria bacterium]|tara:strand:- start:4416 stop:5684 length:1269 start_codon:yes stop_codon:yes gene_type:complete
MINLNQKTKNILSWSAYDFANAPFSTLVVTFIYATYFTQAIAPDPITGTVLWSRAIAITGIIVALFSPFLGAIADCGTYRKKFIILSTLICVIFTAALYPVLPGYVFTALLFFVIANLSYEFSLVFYNSFLSDISNSSNIGRISGFAWAIGYLGGLLTLTIALIGFVQPEIPWFGLSKVSGENIRATNLLVASWFLLFSIPLIYFLEDKEITIKTSENIIIKSYYQLKNTWIEIKNYKEVIKFLIARMFYNDGMITVFAFGGIYAAETFNFTLTEVLIFGIVMNISAGLGAFIMGYIDDFLGGKRTILISLTFLFISTMLAVLANDRLWLWVAGAIFGFFTGPNQSASRSFMARLIPEQKKNEFFGFYAFSGKLTAFIGPFLLGLLTQWSGSQRIGVSIVLLLLFTGFVLLLKVDDSKLRSL